MLNNFIEIGKLKMFEGFCWGLGVIALAFVCLLMAILAAIVLRKISDMEYKAKIKEYKCKKQ